MINAKKLREIVTAALPAARLEELGRLLGVVERQSKVLLGEFVVALVLSARAAAGGRQAEALRLYENRLGKGIIVRGAFYARFTAALAELLDMLLHEALLLAAADPVRLPPSLAFVRDWHVVDSTTVKLDDALKARFRGTGDYAALKVHKRYSIGIGNLVDFIVGGAFEHDSRHFKLDETWRGLGVLLDLGYVSHDLLKRSRAFGVELVIRLKSGWKVDIARVVTGNVRPRKSTRPLNLAHALSNMKVTAVDGVIDADVQLAIDGKPFPMRYVSLAIAGKGICEFLTTVPRDLASASLIGDLYRLRWEIEKDNKLNKSDWVLDAIDARRQESVHALVCASLLGSVIVNRIVHADRVQRLDSKAAPTKGPLHARAVALALATCMPRLAQSTASPETQTEAWLALECVIESTGHDPNWRARPSVLDRLLGFTAPRGRPRRQSENGSASDPVENDHPAATK